MDSISRPSKIPKCVHHGLLLNEPMAMMDQELMDQELMDQEPFPNDLCLKLVFPFLTWKELVQTVDLVDKRWNRIAHDDAVWKTHCDFEMNLMKLRLVNKPKWWIPPGTNPDQDINDNFTDQHKIMKTALSQNPRTKSYRQIFTVGFRMDPHFYMNQGYGPHSVISQSNRRQDQLRLEYIVVPTIGTLRGIFGEPLPQHVSFEQSRTFLKEAHHQEQQVEVKKLLFDFACKDPRRAKMLQRTSPISLEKVQLAKSASEYLLATATILSKQPGDFIFQTSSVLSSFTFGEVTKTLGGLAGKEPTLCMTVAVKYTEQGFEREYKYIPTESESSSLAEFAWPISPVDVVHYFLDSMWPDMWDLQKPYDNDDWDRDQAFDEIIQPWWLNLAEPIRQILLDIYRSRINGLPALASSSDLPLENLRDIVNTDLPFFKRGLERKFWEDMKVDTRDTLLQVFLQKSAVLLDTIRREYREVYGDRPSETNAKLLLSIFLEVALNPTIKSHAILTSEFCRQLPSRREAAFNRWDELVESAKSDCHVMWDPQTAVELDSLVSRIGGALANSCFKFPMNKSQAEFDVSTLEKKFLHSVFSRASVSIPEYHTMRNRIKKIVEDFSNALSDVPMRYRMQEYLQDDVFRGFAAFREHVHVREHAMIALIPLLQHLSASDSKKLVYAAFVHRWQSEVDLGFSSKHFGKQTFAHGDVPCGSPIIDHNIFVDAFRWIKDPGYLYDSKHLNDSKHDTMLRLFGFPLPKNIVASMADFLVERLYQHDHPFDVDACKWSNAGRVLVYLERSVHETPECAQIVWGCLKTAIQNAVRAVEGWNDQDLRNASVREVYSNVVSGLVASCLHTRAVQVLSTLRKLYNGTPFLLLGQEFLPFRVLVQRIKDAPPVVLNAMDMYHAFYDERLHQLLH